MRKNIPLILAISTLVGLLTLIISTDFLVNSIVVKESMNNSVLILGEDTLSVSPIVSNVPSFTDNNNPENLIGGEVDGQIKRFYLNIFPATLSWIVFHGVALSIGVTSMIFMLLLIYDIKKKFEVKFDAKNFFKATIPSLITVIIVTLVSYLLAGHQKSNIIPGSEIMEYFDIVFSDPKKIVGYIESAFFFIGLIPLLGIMMVNIVVNKLFNEPGNSKTNIVSAYKSIKDSLNILAFFSGFLVAIAIIGTRLQRNMIAEQVSGIEKIYPDEFIYAYGISFTLILALIFLPSLFFLKYFKNKKNIISQNESKTLSWWNIGKESIDDIKLIFSIVLPIISSIIASIIE